MSHKHISVNLFWIRASDGSAMGGGASWCREAREGVVRWQAGHQSLSGTLACASCSEGWKLGTQKDPDNESEL